MPNWQTYRYVRCSSLHSQEIMWDKDYRITYWLVQIWTAAPVCLRSLCELCVSWFSSMFLALSPRYTAPPQTLINHSTHWVTFALFKKILQTLAFRKYNYLPFHISAANIPALWAVYLMVFVYRLTFLLYFHFHQIEMAVCASLCESVSGKGNIWCAFYDVGIEILATVNMNRLSSLSHTGLAI